MKCTRKRVLLCSVPIVVFVTAIITCSILFIPKSSKKAKYSWKRSSKDYYPRTSYPCSGKGCSTEDKPQSEAVYKKTCGTEECVLTAAGVIRWMDKSVDPCQDFYNFSCGAFARHHALPDGKDAYTAFDVYRDTVDIKLKGIVETPNLGNDSQSLKNTKDVFRSCMDSRLIEDTGSHQLRAVLSSTGLGEWPFLNPDWGECRTDLEWRMAKLNSMGIPSLVHLETRFLKKADYRLQAVIRVSRPLLDFPCEGDVNETDALDYAVKHRKFLRSVLKLLDVNVTEEVEDDIDDVFRFDFRFCNATRSCRAGETKVVDKEEDRYTLLKLADNGPQINWIRWRNIIFSELRLNFPHDRQKIYVYGVEACIDELDELLRGTTSKVLANYLTWKFVFRHLGFLGSRFRQLLKQYSGVVKRASLAMPPASAVPRWKQCVSYLKQHMPLTLLREYHNLVPHKELRKVMTDVVSRVKNEFRIIMKDTRSLLENDRIQSYHKIDQIQVNVNYPSRDTKFYDTFYTDLGTMGSSFLRNGMKVSCLRMRKMMYGVFTFKSVYDTEYAILGGSDPFDVIAESAFSRNTIVFTLGMLQSYGLSLTLPKYKTLSTFGWTLGHELSHGFDLQALDPVFQSNWTSWPSYVLKQIQKKAQCFATKTVGGDTTAFQLLLDNPTLNEDLCDNQGMHLAFKAYLNYVHNHGDEETLPGLQYSTEQLFFINYAQQFCEVRPSEQSTAQQSAGRRRVNDVIKNFPDFAEAFRCPSNAPMKAFSCDPLWT